MTTETSERVLRLILPTPPSVNHYWRHVVMKGRVCVLISRDGREYKQRVEVACYRQKAQPFACPVTVTFTVYRARRSGDLDNFQKGLFDALKGHAWVDDKQIVEIHAKRRDDKANPRVEIEVRPAGDMDTDGQGQDLTFDI